MHRGVLPSFAGALVFVALGCEKPPVTSGVNCSNVLRIVQCGVARQVTFEPDRVYGPDIDLARDDKSGQSASVEVHYRGRIATETLFLSETGPNRERVLTGAETNFARVPCTTSTDTECYEGLIRGKVVSFYFSPTRLRGRVGSRGFDLKREGGPTSTRYVADAACGPAYPYATLELTSHDLLELALVALTAS